MGGPKFKGQTRLSRRNGWELSLIELAILKSSFVKNSCRGNYIPDDTKRIEAYIDAF